jgi:hypothetical protein
MGCKRAGTELKELELCQLLDQAINAPERKRH